MNIKSLLLGSAAALLAVSGARAADAVEVAAEPEPMEYVRVCDTYGTGYFYIPGTETCLRIGGYVRYDIRAGDGPYGGHEVVDHEDGSTNDTYHKQARLSLRTWTGTETELGTLSTYTEVRFNFRDGHHDRVFVDGEDGVVRLDGQNSWSLNFAWIQLGGFRIGKDESVFTTFPGYAGKVMADDIVPYGPFDTNLISYTFDAGNGFSAILSLEQGSDGSFGHDYSIDSYIPHVVGGLKYAGDWGSAVLVGGYDSIHENFAVKGRVDVKVNEQLSLFVMAGWGEGGDEDDLGSDGSNFYKPWRGDWAVWGGGSYKFSEKATFSLQAAYSDEGWSAGADASPGSAQIGGDNMFAVSANVAYELVPGFVITPEATYFDSGEDDGFSGWLRFQRNF